MKVRNDFVSNSSSSSFIVISDKGNYHQKISDFTELNLPCDIGCKTFGWQTEKYNDIYSKLNWVALIILEKIFLEKNESDSDRLKDEITNPWFRANDMENLLMKVCKEKFNLDISLNKKVCLDDYYNNYDEGYIDHQSNISETPENGRMFESYDKLYDFIANDNSYIDNSNDNGGRDDDEYDFELARYKSQPYDYI